MSRLNGWQKGILYGFIFVFFISLFFTVILIFYDYHLSKKGLPHMCFAFSENTFCSFEEAVFSRIKFMGLIIVSFGIIISFFGGIIGFIVDKIKITE
jgi:hypothetical protein